MNGAETVHWERTILEDAHSRDVLRVVAYGSAPPVLEKRHFYLDSKAGQWKHGKVRGLNGLDLALAFDRLEEYREAILSPWAGKRRAVNGTGPGGDVEPVS